MNESTIAARLKPLAPLPTGLQPKAGRLPPLRCILFDVYGTLFISASGDIGIAQASGRPLRQLKELLGRYGIGRQPAELVEQFYRAIEDDHRKRREKGIDFPEVDIIRIWEEVLGSLPEQQLRDFAVEFEVLSNPTYPMPNLAEVLAACRKTGVRMGLVSNAQLFTPLLFKWLLGADAEKLGFDPRLMFFSYQHGRAKPGRYLFELAADRLQRMQIAPSAALYVGNDMLNDIVPATAAGFHTALFAGDARSLRLREDDPRCSGLSPDLVVTDLGQLIAYLPKPAP